jgi:RNA polymerase sigma-70 factor (ECF subfamily)
MDAWLRDAITAARAAWPTVHLTDEELVDYLGPAGSEAIRADAARAQDLYLACACVAGQPAALALFDKHYLAQVAGHVGRVTQSQDAVHEALQTLRVRLFVGSGGQPPRIRQYHGQGTLLGWVKIAAVRVAIDLARLRDPAAPSSEPISELNLAASRDPELEYIRARYQGDFAAAVREAFATLSTEARSVMRMYILERMNIAEIGAVVGVHRATIARWIAAARAQLLEETRARLRKRLGSSTSEVESLLRLLDSQLEASIV